MKKFSKYDENLSKELAALGNDDLFLEDLRQLKARYPDRYLKHYLKYEEEWREIAFRLTQRLWGHIGPFCASFIEECRTKRLAIHGPTVRIQFEDDVAVLCEKWCLRWEFSDVGHRTACRWVSSVLLNWKPADGRPDLTETPCPPRGLVVPIVRPTFKNLSGALVSGPHPCASEVQLMARSSVGKRDIIEAAKRAYASLRHPSSWIANVPLKGKGGRPRIPTQTRERIIAEFLKKLRSHRGTDKELISIVSRELNLSESQKISIKSYEKLLAEARTQITPSRSHKRYLTAKLDTRR